MQESTVITVARGAVARAIEHSDAASARSLAESISGRKALASDDEAVEVVDAAKTVRTVRLGLESQLKTITEPLRQAERAARDLAAGPIGALKAAEDKAKALVLGWNAEKERQRLRLEAEAKAREAEAAKAREAEAASAGTEAMDMPPEASTFTPPPSTQIKGGVGAMHERRVQNVEVVDLVEVARHNPHLLKLDKAEAKRTIAVLRRRDGLDASIPGLRFYEEKGATLR